MLYVNYNKYNMGTSMNRKRVACEQEILLCLGILHIGTYMK